METAAANARIPGVIRTDTAAVFHCYEEDYDCPFKSELFDHFILRIDRQ